MVESTEPQESVSIYETLVPLTPNVIDFKVGLFRSRSRLGRVVQGAGTYALPGDTTAIRHPLRSGLYQAATPGGGGLGRRIGGRRNERLRCPAGFEFGGRFSNAGLTNCGRQLFESLSAVTTAANRNRGGAAGATLREAVGDIANAPSGQSRSIRNLTSDASPVLSRAVNIPDVGRVNKPEQESKIMAAAAEVVNDGKPSSRLVRRDGVSLRPVVSIRTLRQVRDNPDMDGAAFVLNVTDPAKIGDDELPTLMSTNLRSLVWAFPGGGTIRLDKVGDLTAGQRRRLSNAFRQARADQDEFDYDAPLREIAGMADAISLSVKFPGVANPNERIMVRNAKGQQRIVPRWVHHVFLAPSADLRGNRPAWSIVEGSTKSAEGFATADTKNLFMGADPVSVVDGPILRSSQEAWLASIAYKTSAHVANTDFSSYAFEFKRVAAMWDPDLPPEGGFRCPPGTRYGGRITDRFGRNCGWNVGRRLANRLETLGRNIGDAADERRDNQVARRVRAAERGVARQERRIERAQDRIANIRGVDANGNPLPQPGRRSRRLERRLQARPDARERGAQRRERIANRLGQFADRMDGGEGRRSRRPSGRERRGVDAPGRRDRVADRLGEFADRMDGGEGRRRRQEREAARANDGPGRRDRIADRLGRFADRMDGGEGRRERRGEEAAAPAANRPRGRRRVGRTRAEQVEATRRPGAGLVNGGQGVMPRQPRRPDRSIDNPDTSRERVRVNDQPEIDMGNDRDGFLRINGWEDRDLREMSEDEIRERFDTLNAQEAEARQDPDGFDPFRAERREYLSQLRRERARRTRQRNQERNRRRREQQRRERVGEDNQVPDVADDQAPEVEVSNAEADKAIEEVLGEGNIDRVERAEQNLGGVLARDYDAWFDENKDDIAALRDEIDMATAILANADLNPGRLSPEDRFVIVANMARIRQRIAELENPAPNVDDIGGSMPDERSLRNVRNRFRHRGLPDTAWWRQAGASDPGVVELDRRFGRYYDEDGNINARGRLVNGMLAAERGEDIQPEVEGLPADNPAPESSSAPIDLGDPKVLDIEAIAQADEQLGRFGRSLDAEIEAVENDRGELQRLRDMYQRGVDGRQNGYRNERAINRYMRLQERDMQQAAVDRIDARLAELEKKDQVAELRRESEQAAGVVDPFDGDPAAEIARRVGMVREKRGRILGKYLDKRYGDSKPWEDPNVNLPPERLAELGRQANVDPEAKRELQRWAKSVFQLPEFEAAGGMKFKTEVIGVSSFGGEPITVNGRIMAFNSATNQWERVGKFTRAVYPGESRVYNQLMAIGRQGDVDTVFAETKAKNAGFTTVFNAHSFMYYRAAGFDKVTVTAGLSDGPFVWGRVGFRAQNSRNVQNLADNMQAEVARFRNNQPSIITNEQDAVLLESLANKAAAVGYDPKKAPTHAEYILALENDGSKAREQQLKNWFYNKGPLGSGVIQFEDDQFGLDPRTQQKISSPTPVGPPPHGRNMLADFLGGREVRTPLADRPLAGKRDRSGRFRPQIFSNGAIRSQASADEHIKNGGSLAEVPNRYWLKAIMANSVEAAALRRDPAAGRGKRFVFNRPGEGAMGDTRIFVMLDNDGKPTGQGFVLKGAVANESAGEVIGYNLAADHGIMPEGAMWDGLDRGAQGAEARGASIPFVVIPHAYNAAPEGDVAHARRSYDADLLANTPDRGLPEMFGHLLHNYLLNISDRHSGNGMTMVVNGQPVVVPVDQARIGRGPGGPLADYVRGFSMHPGILGDVRNHANTLQGEDRTRYVNRLAGVYDGMLERAQRNISGGREAFVARMLRGVPTSQRPAAESAALNAWRTYYRQVENMRDERDRFLASLGYAV